MTGAASIRLATVNDIPPLIAIAEAIPSLPQWTAAQFRDMVPSRQDGGLVHAMWIAEADGVVAGFTAASLLRAVEPPEADLENLAVAPAHRRLGLGRSLLARVADWAAEAGCATLRLEVRSSNHEALALYAGAGFLPAGTRRSYYTAPVEDAMCMELPLLADRRCC